VIKDLRDLFSHVGRVARVYVGRDRETGIGTLLCYPSDHSDHTTDRYYRQRFCVCVI
jgi:hypothetical protein